MLGNFSEEAQFVLLKAREEMISLNHPYIGTEHLILSLLKNDDVLAKRYNDRLSSGNRHLALYTLNQYPVIDGISEFHPLITRDDVERIEQGIQEFTFGQEALEINTDDIESEFETLCSRVIEFIS